MEYGALVAQSGAWYDCRPWNTHHGVANFHAAALRGLSAQADECRQARYGGLCTKLYAPEGQESIFDFGCRSDLNYPGCGYGGLECCRLCSADNSTGIQPCINRDPAGAAELDASTPHEASFLPPGSASVPKAASGQRLLPTIRSAFGFIGDQPRFGSFRCVAGPVCNDAAGQGFFDAAKWVPAQEYLRCMGNADCERGTANVGRVGMALHGESAFSVRADGGYSVEGKSLLLISLGGNDERVSFSFPPLNASSFSHLHLSVWTERHQRITIRLRDLGSTNSTLKDVPGAGSTSSEGVGSAALRPSNATGDRSSWNEVDIALTELQASGLQRRGNIALFTAIVFPAGGSFVLDNVFFYNIQLKCEPFRLQWWLTSGCFSLQNTGPGR